MRVRNTTDIPPGVQGTVTGRVALTTPTPMTSTVSPLAIYFWLNHTNLPPAYKSAIEWIQQQIDSNEKYLTDDTRFWVDVTAI